MFNKIDWADSEIKDINIKYNELKMTIYNDTLNKDLMVVCKNFAGITNLCIWDDTYIHSAKLEKVDNDCEFYRVIINAYTNNNGEVDKFNKDRTLDNGLLKLSICLINGITCEIYCQSVDII